MAYNVITVLPSAARTTSGNASILAADTGDTLALQVDVSAASGTTPTLDISIQWSMDGTIWSPAATPDTFTQITAVSSAVKTFAVKAPNYRVVYAIAGTTPSFTFSVRSYETT